MARHWHWHHRTLGRDVKHCAPQLRERCGAITPVVDTDSGIAELAELANKQIEQPMGLLAVCRPTALPLVLRSVRRSTCNCNHMKRLALACIVVNNKIKNCHPIKLHGCGG
jgi:hypothetical protein